MVWPSVSAGSSVRWPVRSSWCSCCNGGVGGRRSRVVSASPLRRRISHYEKASSPCPVNERARLRERRGYGVRSGERFGLEGLVLRLREDSGIEQRIDVRDL